jgi:acyl-CoA hydrolase
MTSSHPWQPDFVETYRRKCRSMREVVDLLRPDDVVAAPIAGGQPAGFLTTLAERDDWRDFTLFSGLLIAPYAVLTNPNVRMISGFYGPIERMLRSMGARVDYLPADFIGWERYAMVARPRVVVSALAPMDDRGYLSFGVHAGATFNAFLEAARDPERLAIAEVVRDMPHVYGLGRHGGNRIHVSEVDYLVESDRPLFVLPEIPVAPEDTAIAHHVESLIENGATLQIGIGGVPNIVAQLLAEGGKGDFGIHTEMLVDGIMRLHKAGKVSNHKGVHDGFSVCTFAAGSRALYEWMDRNPEVRMLPVMQVNDPAVIRRNRKMVSINGAIAIDVAGQVTAEAIGARQYSGVGGHELFVMGAHDSREGKSIICLHSTARVDGTTMSTILAALPRGARVSTPRHHVQYVVTEHGVANIGMLTDGERAEALIAIAHPDFRESLRAEVAALGR